MDHPFEVGEAYRDRNGRYQVLAIEAPKMRVRYADGSTAVVTISVQALAWGMWQNMPEPPPPPVTKSAPRKGRQQTGGRAPKISKQERLIAEILKEDTAVREILTRLVIPPGQIALYRHFLKHPDDYFSQQDIADAVRGGDVESERGVFMAFGRRIGEAPDARVSSLKPRNSLFFERKQGDGKTLLRIRPRVVEIFQSYAQFYAFLMEDDRSWLPEAFGTPHWEDTPEVQRRQMAFFGFDDPAGGAGG